MAEYYKRKLSLYQKALVEVMTLAEAKLYLRVDGSDEDILISTMINAARISAEQYLRKSLPLQQWKLSYDGEMPSKVYLPMGDVNSIISLNIIAADESSEIVNSDFYCLRQSENILELDSILNAHRIEVIYSAGYADITDIPEAIRQGIYAHISALYDGRDGGDMPKTSQMLYNPFKEMSV